MGGVEEGPRAGEALRRRSSPRSLAGPPVFAQRRFGFGLVVDASTILSAMVRLLVMASLVAAPSFAEDCTLSEDALRPQLDARKLPKGAKVTAQKRKDRLHRETLRFADGLEATLQVSGCEHLGLLVALNSTKAVPATITPADAVALMKKVLPTLPVGAQATLRPAMFLDALSALKTVPSAFPVVLDCGEFTSCELSLDTTTKSPSLVIAYDFAL